MLKKTCLKIEDGKAIVNGLIIEIDHIILKKAFKPGANGIVFQAYDKLLERDVAVKVWIPKKGDYRDKNEQALAEARKIAKLDHPKIVKIYAPGLLDNGLFYIIMQLLQGETLKSFLKNKPQLKIRLNLWHDIFDALSFAHSKYIYHGDLHDRNIIVNEGQAILIDFGTSIFAKKKVNNPLEREGKNIIKIVKRIFPEFDMLSTHELRFLDIKPEKILQISDAIVEINLNLLGLKDAIKETDNRKIRNNLLELGTTISENPFFRPEYIINLFRDIHFDEIYVSYLLDILSTFLISEIEGKNMCTVKHNPHITIEDKLTSIEPLLQKRRMFFNPSA